MKTLPTWCQAIRVSYTEQGHRFYGVYLHDAPTTVNHRWTEKIRDCRDFEELVESLGILEADLVFYNEQQLSFIAGQLWSRYGVQMDFDADFDIS